MKGRRFRFIFLALALAAVILPANAFAHAVVLPGKSVPGATERYVLRIPNERDVTTTRVEIRFPRSVRVISFADVPGWSLEVISDSAKHVIGAVWTGSLAPQRFVEFPFVAVNPKSPVALVWPAFQTYSNGERIDWVGRDDAKQPAAVTLVVGTSRSGSGVVLALWICIGAFALSIAGLVLALRPDSGKPGFQG